MNVLWSTAREREGNCAQYYREEFRKKLTRGTMAQRVRRLEKIIEAIVDECNSWGDGRIEVRNEGTPGQALAGSIEREIRKAVERVNDAD